MNLLLLGGNSSRNQPWIQEVATACRDSFTICHPFVYRHWSDHQPSIDFNYEYGQLSTLAPSLQPYVIFAKSLGTLLTLRGSSDKTLQPAYCVLVGFPLQVVLERDEPVADWLKVVECSVLFAQNTSDPLGSYEDVVSYLETINNSHIRTAQLPGKSHDYTDIGKLKEMLVSNPVLLV